MISPKGDYILVRVLKENNNGLIISDKEESQKGIVIEVGPGILDHKSGQRTEMFVQPTDTVIWQKFADADYSFEYNGETHALVKIQQIMGVDNE